MKKTITTDNAPAAIGTYSQAVQHGGLLYVSGQIPLVPSTMELVSPDINQQINQVFDNLSAIAVAAGTTLNDAVKLTVYLTDLGHFSSVNEVMAQRLGQPYPARVALEVSALPRSALVEIDAIVAIS
ncbi:MAG: RidA family protein [Gammaproteobacteria bacterium]|jgi:reactive intermediate/imine deaminase|nr:RidA family protein [Gammaproteobacteria bacterium]MBT5155068.1 RidA family protein [Gammaproteobacteria bacterium]MBT5722500.1 RidA family protein [Gammaproteobacteria bacterium]MBT6584530.1 RidA family protein [Gammaproteobacteria bacterium]MBT6890852.1 RidA family protein [Gammaproteobacteria bacterium]